MNILGISAFYHDSAAALLRDGEVVAAAQEERFSRKKHDPLFPKHAIEFCLRQAKIRIADVDYIVFYDKPLVKFERILSTFLAYAPTGIRAFYDHMPPWLREKLFVRRVIRKELGYQGKILFSTHHLSHAASAFFPSPYEDAAIITVDGVGEWSTTTYGVGEGNRINLLGDIKFPHSLGLLYSAVTYFTGFKVNSGEYKLMGLAPYGEPKYVDDIRRELIDIRDDGSFRLNMDYFSYGYSPYMTNDKFSRLFGGPPRKAETRITQREMDLARSVQEVTEEVMLKMSRYVHSLTSKKNLCLAGGVALNCVANGRILREGPFDDLWVQPCAGDGGTALGAAMFVWHQLLNQTRVPDRARQHATYLGPEFTDEEIKTYLDSQQIPYRALQEEELAPRVAALIADAKVVGWFQGRMEYGPRALGARSILGDPRSPEMQSVLNLKIKFRESFRPFAPSVLMEHASECFDLRGHESPYMLLVADVLPSHLAPLDEDEKHAAGFARLGVVRSDIPAVTHVDNSARIQTVRWEDNIRYYDLIRAFYDRTGCPVLINTSFNVRGEPIVCTPHEAFTCFMRTHMDYLVLGSFLLDKAEQKAWKDESDWQADYELD